MTELTDYPDFFTEPEFIPWNGRLFISGIKLIARRGETAGLLPAVQAFYSQQIESWRGLREAVAGLKRMNVRRVKLDGRRLLLQHNPARLKNITVTLEPGKLAGRPCPICPQTMPAGQQALPFDKNWLVVCNPLPIFPSHFVLIYRRHEPQAADDVLSAMLRFTRLTGYVTLYNGPRCGASIPDHLHLQASPPGCLPLERQLPPVEDSFSGVVADSRLPRRIFLFGRDDSHAEKLFARTTFALGRLQRKTDVLEPALNLAVVSRGRDRTPLVAVHPRARHRPECFFYEGERRFMISPGAADTAGLVILPRKEDFDRLDGRRLRSIFSEVMLDEERFAQAVRIITS
ncbi:MAG TPA: DUF4922 domain-containing protein [Candidatus Glassbacteria bacterium]|nr:DUF4922 domain-containing protein [Candidatus Glassbacteria bacterium]